MHKKGHMCVYESAVKCAQSAVRVHLCLQGSSRDFSSHTCCMRCITWTLSSASRAAAIFSRSRLLSADCFSLASAATCASTSPLATTTCALRSCLAPLTDIVNDFSSWSAQLLRNFLNDFQFKCSKLRSLPNPRCGTLRPAQPRHERIPPQAALATIRLAWTR